MMSRVGNNAAAAMATIVCIAFVLSIILPFAGAAVYFFMLKPK